MKPNDCINPKLPTLWHGGDYNPDQWPDETQFEDLRLMELVNANVMSVGIFSWSQLEPEPGVFALDWLDRTFERLGEQGVYIALATPTAAHPRWLSQMYPEVQAVDHTGRRLPHGERQRFCPSSRIYREHAARIIRLLAERYGQHDALVLWHVSNEYVPRCHCDLCAHHFRAWLRRRYGDLDTLNHQYWSAFWSQRYTNWEQLGPVLDNTGRIPHCHRLDWMRFQSHQMLDFFKFECDILRGITPDIPITTNMMGKFKGLDYAKFAAVMDVVSWDCYGRVGADPVHMAFDHALMRGVKANKPWILMEQTPSSTNWMAHGTLKPPGMFGLWSWQAIAHGSDASMYFQWRRSRGGPEKFHGAVVAHVGHDKPRVFQDVATLGDQMAKVGPRIVGTQVVKARIALISDQENRWAVEEAAGYAKDRSYFREMEKHFRAVWSQNYPVDVIPPEADWSQYEILIAPQLYMVKSGRFPLEGTPEELAARIDLAAKLTDFVKQGGTLVTTFLSGIVNESDLVYEGGYPGPLRSLLGIWVEETDCHPEGAATNEMVISPDYAPDLGESFHCERFFDMIHTSSAEVIATYGGNWYADRPCVTRNSVGRGRAYYIGTDPEPAFLEAFYHKLANIKSIEPLIPATPGVEVLERANDRRRIVFLLNHNDEATDVNLADLRGKDLLTEQKVSGQITLDPYNVKIIEL